MERVARAVSLYSYPASVQEPRLQPGGCKLSSSIPLHQPHLASYLSNWDRSCCISISEKMVGWKNIRRTLPPLAGKACPVWVCFPFPSLPSMIPTHGRPICSLPPTQIFPALSSVFVHVALCFTNAIFSFHPNCKHLTHPSSNCISLFFRTFPPTNLSFFLCIKHILAVSFSLSGEIIRFLGEEMWLAFLWIPR